MRGSRQLDAARAEVAALRDASQAPPAGRQRHATATSAPAHGWLPTGAPRPVRHRARPHRGGCLGLWPSPRRRGAGHPLSSLLEPPPLVRARRRRARPRLTRRDPAVTGASRWRGHGRRRRGERRRPSDRGQPPAGRAAGCWRRLVRRRRVDLARPSPPSARTRTHSSVSRTLAQPRSTERLASATSPRHRRETTRRREVVRARLSCGSADRGQLAATVWPSSRDAISPASVSISTAARHRGRPPVDDADRQPAHRARASSSRPPASARGRTGCRRRSPRGSCRRPPRGRRAGRPRCRVGDLDRLRPPVDEVENGRQVGAVRKSASGSSSSSAAAASASRTARWRRWDRCPRPSATASVVVAWTSWLRGRRVARAGDLDRLAREPLARRRRCRRASRAGRAGQDCRPFRDSARAGRSSTARRAASIGPGRIARRRAGPAPGRVDAGGPGGRGRAAASSAADGRLEEAPSLAGSDRRRTAASEARTWRSTRSDGGTRTDAAPAPCRQPVRQRQRRSRAPRAHQRRRDWLLAATAAAPDGSRPGRRCGSCAASQMPRDGRRRPAEALREARRDSARGSAAGRARPARPIDSWRNAMRAVDLDHEAARRAPPRARPQVGVEARRAASRGPVTERGTGPVAVDVEGGGHAGELLRRQRALGETRREAQHTRRHSRERIGQPGDDRARRTSRSATPPGSSRRAARSSSVTERQAARALGDQEQQAGRGALRPRCPRCSAASSSRSSGGEDDAGRRSRARSRSRRGRAIHGCVAADDVGLMRPDDRQRAGRARSSTGT